MLGYGVELKGKSEIEALCYETEGGGLGQDSIAFEYATLSVNGFYDPSVKLVEVTEYEDDMYAYLIQNYSGAKIYVHLDWFAKIDGYNTIKYDDMSTTMRKVTRDAVIDPKTGKLTKVSSLPICDCGAISTTTYSDGTHICGACIEKATKIHNYSFKPAYKFIGEQLTADRATPTWYGLEVEMSTNREKLAEFMHKNKDAVYLKSDSSIRGNGFKAEMVSHPHSFKALMAKDSWLSKIDMLPAELSDSNGCHVHIGRTAFSDDKHYSLFYFLLHKMERIAVKVGGRELTSYCSLAPTGKVHKKGNKKENNTRRDIFLNETNDVTVEARFFKGTTDSSKLKAYVQFLESIIKYTKYHATTVTSKGWFGYISKKSKKYADLLVALEGITDSDLDHTVTYKEPELVKYEFGQLLAREISCIVELTLRDGKVFKDVEVSSVSATEVAFYYENKRDHTSRRITEIAKITLEKE